MLKLYLSYNQVLHEYNLFSGKTWEQRHYVLDLGKEEGLLKRLKNAIDLRRHSTLEFIGVSEEVASRVMVELEDTKIEVAYEE